MTAAAVHLELDPRLAANRLRVDAQSAPSDDIAFGSGIEYLIAICFVVLIVVTIGPAVLLQSLQLVQVVVRRQDPDYPRRLRLARSLLSDPTARRSLERFTSQQCLQHWALVACFAILAVTGFPLTFADRAWAAWLVAQVGGLGVARNIHRGAGVLLLAGFAYHVAYVAWHVWRQKSETGQGRLRTIGDLPMVLRKGDWKRLLHLLAYLLFLQKTRPAAGRFTLREKFDYVGVL